MAELSCWNCGELLTEVPLPISRHENCPQCFTELHCCRLCRYYDPQIPDQCEEDRADPPVNKEVGNFCEWFQPRAGAYAYASTRTQKKDVSLGKLDSLFGGSKSEEDQPDNANSSPATTEDDVRAKLDSLFPKDE
ncbi:MAG: hypothetical protein IH908_03105 [Proteobacteria bacterium]|nr:hypothetical protein [Pseudomonadota bacterium]